MSELTLAELLAQADEAAAVSLDMTEVVSRGGGTRLLPEGYAFGRLVEYTEFGMQKQEFQGKAQEPAMEVQIGFALYGEGYQNEDGTPYIIRVFPFALKQNDGARSFKLFKALNTDGTKTHFGQLLGRAYLVKIENVPKSKTDATLVSRIDLTGFLPPVDPVSKRAYDIPMPDIKYFRTFFWNRPTLEGWESLKIEASADGKVRNFIQERIMEAVDYEGSPLQILLGGGAAALALPGAAAQVAAPLVTPAAAVQANPSVAVSVATPVNVTAVAQPAAVAAPGVVNPAPVVANPAVPLQPIASVQPAAVPPAVAVPTAVAQPATPA